MILCEIFLDLKMVQTILSEPFRVLMTESCSHNNPFHLFLTQPSVTQNGI